MFAVFVPGTLRPLLGWFLLGRLVVEDVDVGLNEIIDGYIIDLIFILGCHIEHLWLHFLFGLQIFPKQLYQIFILHFFLFSFLYIRLHSRLGLSLSQRDFWFTFVATIFCAFKAWNVPFWLFLFYFIAFFAQIDCMRTFASFYLEASVSLLLPD